MAFLRDECELGASQRSECDALFEKYAGWCRRQGYLWTGTSTSIPPRSACGSSRVEGCPTPEDGERAAVLPGCGVKPFGLGTRWHALQCTVTYLYIYDCFQIDDTMLKHACQACQRASEPASQRADQVIF